MNLKELLPNILQRHQFECLSTLKCEDPISWLKSVGGFANSDGGEFFLGVDGKDLNLIGFDSSKARKEKMYFHSMLMKHLSYLPTYNSELIPFYNHEERKYIIQINVFKSSIRPIIVEYQEMPMIFMRRDGFTNAASVEEIRQMSIASNMVSYDKQPTQEKFDENDFKELAAFYEERNNGKKINKKELESIGFIDKNGCLYKGSRLFKDDYDGADTAVVCSLYKGLNKGDDMVLASNSFRGNLISSIKFIWEFVQQRMNHGFIKKDTGRVDVDSYGSRALFEAIINAIAHREYFLQGSQISVDLFNNRLSISSPGSLFNAGDLAPTYSFDSIVSRRRNELICGVFVYCKAMEAKGTGFEKIKDDYKECDSQHKPFIFSKNNQFTLVLPDKLSSSGVSIQEESLRIIGEISNPTRFDLDILAFCYDAPRSVKEIATNLGVEDSTYLRKEAIGNLFSQGFLRSSQKGNATLYFTSKDKVSLH